ncbi:MAG TPA: ATP-binding protein [Opitutaceae bacterium]|nr:ATP-binding protein [Opitutaceae bacterium]
MDSTRRKTFFILSLALSLVVALIAILLDDELLNRLGDSYWFVALVIIACVLIVLSGYAFDLTLQKRLKTLRAQTIAPFETEDKPNEPDHDEIIGLARNIERMARSLQKVEANYRAIVEDQIDLICRYRPDGKTVFVNGAYARAFGRKRSDLTGQLFPFYAPQEVIGDAPHTFERDLVLADGRRTVYLWSQRAIRDDAGAIIEYQAVGHDITLQKESEAALLRAKEAAETADRAKSEFLAVVSHEIRTPINGVIGFAKMLEDSPLTAEQREHVAMIHTSGHALEKLISDILDLSKIEAGRIDIEHSAFALHRTVEEVCTLFVPEARAAGLTLDVAIEPGVPPIINGDSARLRQILTNLVGNALKFTERGGVKIHVSCARGEALMDGIHHSVRVFFSVSDTGIGIPEEKIGELFKPFMQVDASSKRRRGGTGLGLAISKRLCGLMGGAISVDTRLGHGSTFRFSVVADYDPRDSALPVKPVTLPAFRPGFATS